jgi:hypothetical protein
MLSQVISNKLLTLHILPADPRPHSSCYEGITKMKSLFMPWQHTWEWMYFFTSSYTECFEEKKNLMLLSWIKPLFCHPVCILVSMPTTPITAHYQIMMYEIGCHKLRHNQYCSAFRERDHVTFCNLSWVYNMICILWIVEGSVNVKLLIVFEWKQWGYVCISE